MKKTFSYLYRIFNAGKKAILLLLLGYSDPVSQLQVEREIKDKYYFGFPEVLSSNFSILANGQGLGRSMETKLAVDADGEPIPWYTYPAIEYIKQMDISAKNIFEYGCGYSSLYWAGRAGKVCSVDHNADWIEKIRPLMRANQQVLMRENRDQYARAICEFTDRLDIIVIDGAWRNECVAEVLKRADPETIIILDNSDWYRDVAATLKSNSYFEISFSGFGPIANFTWTTSIFIPWNSSWGNGISDPEPIGSVKVTKCKENEEYW